MKSYSQYGQDHIVDEMLNNKTGGVFVDIGAHDGISLSNSKFFEEYRGWTGVCFEPNPVVFDTLRSNRTCQCVNKGASDKDGTLNYLKLSGYTEMLSGFVEFYDAAHLRRIDAEIGEMGGSKETIEIGIVNLGKYLVDNGITNVDYMSIDTEGGEYNIIKSIDFSIVKVKILTVENNYGETDTRNLLASYGYTYKKHHADDLFYLNKSL